MDKEENKKREILEKMVARKWQRPYSKFFEYYLDGKMMDLAKAEKIFGNKLYEFIGEYFDSRYKGCKEMEFSTEHGVLKIVDLTQNMLRAKQRYYIDFAPGYIPDYKKEEEELCKSAKYKLNGKTISKENAEELFGEREVSSAIHSAAWHFLISPDFIINYDSRYGELSFCFLKKIRNELLKKRESEFKFTKSKNRPKSQ